VQTQNPANLPGDPGAGALVWIRSFVPATPLARYGAGLLAALLAVSLTLLLGPLIGSGSFLLLLPAVVLGAWYGGFGPGLFTALICAFGYAGLIAKPSGFQALAVADEAWRVGLFLGMSVLLVWLVEALHAAQRTAETTARQLRVSQERYRHILQTAQEGVCTIDPTARVDYLNPRLAEMLGTTVDEVLGQPLWSFLEPEAQKDAERRWEQRRVGPRDQHEFRFRRKDGSALWALVTTSPILDDQGQPRGALAMITDLTERRRTEEALRFIVDATQVLASSLDYESTLRSVARLAVPALADGCSIDVLMDDGTVRRLANVHADPAREDLVGQLPRRYPTDRHGADGLAKVLATGRPELLPEVPDTLLQKEARDAEHLKALRGLGIRSCMIVPLRARGRTLGAITLQSAESGRRFGPSDLTLAETLARRATLAVDNALLYREAQKEIAERKLIEEALRASEERLRLALAAGRMGVWDWNLRTGAFSWSESLERIHGLEPGTFGGTYEAFMALVHADDRERVRQALALAVEARTGYAEEFRTVRPDGALHWIIVRGRVFADEAGEPVRMLGIGADVTDRKDAEQEALHMAEDLRNQQKWLEAVVDLMPAPMVFVEPDTARVLFANRAADEMAGGHFPRAQSAEEYHLLYYYTDADRQRIPDEQMPAVRVARGESFAEIELDWHLPDGPRSFLLQGDTIPPMYGHPATGVIKFQDITQLKEVEAELRGANQAKDEFLAMLAHELRNPLAPLLNALHIMRLQGATAETILQAREMAERQVKNMTRLIDDLLDVSRITRGKIQLRQEPVDLATVVRRAIETSRPMIEARGHALHVTLPDMQVQLRADATRLEQVIANLLHNAAKYTEEGGRIEVEAGSEAGEAVVRVRDTGIGIPVEMLPRIFDLFVQADRSLDRSQGGLGIGLTLVKRLVELHGGRIEGHSEGPGKGSEFVVRLPLAGMVQLPEPAAPVEKPQRVNGAPLRVLVVDDNVDAARSLTMLLQAYGHEVRATHSGAEAVRAAAEFFPRVVFLDIGLPGMDGHEVARHLRAQPGGDEVLLVALTGYGQEEDRRRSREAGCDRHLVKPVDPEELEQLLATCEPVRNGS
jgi:PAS domain S-box-containing protein